MSYQQPETIATLSEALNTQNADYLKKLVQLLPVSKTPTRKADLIALIESHLQGETLQTLWSQLDELQQAVVSEVVHSDNSRYQSEQFVAKYGQLPNWGTGRGNYDFKPSKLNLFLYSSILPEDLKKRLKSFVPKPIDVKLNSVETIPDVVQLQTYQYNYQAQHSQEVTVEIPLAQRVMELVAPQNLLAVLRLVQAGKVAVSDKTRHPSAATQKAIAAVLQGGDYYTQADEPNEPTAQKIGDMQPFAWCLFVQAAGLAELAGKKLQLTKTGHKALSAPPADTLRSIWQKWLKTNLIDEFRRIDEIKGQTGKGSRSMTAVSGRRAAIATALSECPIGKWMHINEFCRYMQAKQHTFEVTRDPWTLYICESGYGSLGNGGYHNWEILQGRYALCFLFEYAATLGLIDVAYTPPYGARPDYGDLWGTDDLEFLSRYDGLLYLRLNSLGAYCLNLSHKYTPSPVERRSILKVMSNREVAAVAELTAGDRLLLELYLEQESDHVWKLEQEKLLAAVEAGHTLAAFRDFLIAKSDDEIPPIVEQFLRDLQERTQSLKTQGMAMIIECLTPALAALIANDSRTKKFCLLAGDRHLMVPIEAETKFRNALRKLGYSFSN